MVRTIVKIAKELCIGCGICATGCSEGALHIIDGKASVVSDSYCNGVGTCIKGCPTGAITLEKREANSYDEAAVQEHLLSKYCTTNLSTSNSNLPIARQISLPPPDFSGAGMKMERTPPYSELRQFPIQLHLLNPLATFLSRADILLAADCTAFANGEFHSRFLHGKRLAIACPKLDNHIRKYEDKLVAMIDDIRIGSLTVIMMDVACCKRLILMTNAALKRAQRNMNARIVLLSISGEVVHEEWISA